ncbi:hypothetical protein K8Q93_03835 [Candidatus Parcubacteria bacterium]|nr:hypothetical protein [Candidatus Parcubacteria bacterium]
MRILSLLFLAIAFCASSISASAGITVVPKEVGSSPLPPAGGGFTVYVNGQEIRCTFTELEPPHCVSSASVREDRCRLSFIGGGLLGDTGLLRAHCKADPKGDAREFLAGALKDMSAFCPSLPLEAGGVIRNFAGKDIRSLTRWVFMVFGNEYSARYIVPGVVIAIQPAPYWPYPIDGYLRVVFVDQRITCEVLMDTVDLSPEPVQSGGSDGGDVGRNF